MSTQKDSGKPRKIVSAVECGAIVGKHRNTILKWIDQGMPFVKKADRNTGQEWELNMPDVIEWIKDRAVKDAVAATGSAEGDGITIEEAKRRRAVADAAMAEIELDEKLGRVVAVDDVLDAVGGEYAAVRSHLKALGSKLAGRVLGLPTAPEIQALIDQAVHETLEGLTHDERLSAQVCPWEGRPAEGAGEVPAGQSADPPAPDGE